MSDPAAESGGRAAGTAVQAVSWFGRKLTVYEYVGISNCDRRTVTYASGMVGSLSMTLEPGGFESSGADLPMDDSVYRLWTTGVPV